MADQLCLVADVKSRLGITDASDDALITDLIEGVTSYVQDRVGRKLVPDNAATYTFDTSYGSELYIRRGIRAVTSLQVAATDQPDAGGTYATVSSSLALLRPLAHERKEGWPPDTLVVMGVQPVFALARNGARIAGDFGFAAVPPGVEQLALDAVVSAYQQRGNPASSTFGADAKAGFPWAQMFAEGTSQADVLNRVRGVWGIG